MSLKKEFFGGEDVGLEVKAKVIFGDDERDDIIGEYLKFCRILKEERKKTRDKKKAIKAALKRCIAGGILAEYLEEHRRELEEAMFTFMTQEEVTESYGRNRYRDGEKRGISIGEKRGISTERNISYKNYAAMLDSGLVTKDGLLGIIRENGSEDAVRDFEKYYAEHHRSVVGG